MKRIVPALLGALSLIGALGGAARAEGPTQAWGWRAPVAVTGQSGFVNLEVDAASPLWEGAAGATGAALRVFDGQGAEVPFLLWRPEAATRPATAQVINVGKDAGSQSLTTTLDFGPGPPRLSSLELTVDGPDRYLLPVTVQGSHDQQAWTELTVLDYIYDLRAQGAGRSGLLRLQTPVQMRYLRIFVPNTGVVPLRLTRAVGIAVTQSAPLPWQEAFAGKPALARNAAEKRTTYTVDMGRQRLVRDVALTVTHKNFSRPVVVEGSRDGQQWQHLGSGVVYAYDLEGRKAANPPVPFSECACRYLRLLIADGDDAPLPIETVTLRGLPARLLFEAQPQQRYWVYTGNPQAGLPAYDLARLPVNREAAPTVGIGAVEPNPSYQDSRPFADRHPWVLWAAIGLAVAVVGYAVVRMARSLLRDGPQPPGP